MLNYLVSFRILKSNSAVDIKYHISKALSISPNRAQDLIKRASKHSDIKIKVTAEQLGNLQATRIIHRLADEIRYLCDVEQILDEPQSKVIELREGLRK